MAGASIHRIEKLNYALGAVLVLAALVTQSRSIALGVSIGAGLTCLNFYVLRRLVVKWTAEAAAGQAGNAQLLMVPKMIGLMGAVAVAVFFLPINVIAFTVGYSIFIVSIVIEATYSGLRHVPEEAPEGKDHG